MTSHPLNEVHDGSLALLIIAKTLPPMQLHKTKSMLLVCGDHFTKG